MTAVDSQVSLRIQRAGAELTVAVTIRELSDDPENLAGGVSPSKQRLKILVAELNERQRRELDGNGVVVENVIDGPSARAGLQSGDIILKLNHQDIETLAHFERLVAELPVGQSVPMLVQREQGRLFLALTLPEQTGK
jgi:serine protease Do